MSKALIKYNEKKLQKQNVPEIRKIKDFSFFIL